MRTTMTSRERILATVAGEETDHVPFCFDVHPSYQQYEPELANWADQFERTRFLLSLGLDPMTEAWLPDPSFHPAVTVREWREDAKDPQGRAWLYKEYETPAGTLRQVVRETDDLYEWHKINRNTCGPIADLIDGVGLLEDVNPSRSVEFLIKGPQDLEKMRYLFYPPSGDAYARWKEDIVHARGQAEKTQTVFLARRLYMGSGILWLTDVQETICAYETDPDYVGEFLRIIEDWQLKMLDMVLDQGVDMVTRFGYYDTPDFWGRKYFERYLLGPMDQEAEICEQAGAYLSQQQSEGLTQLAELYKHMKVHILRDVDPVQGGEDLDLLKRELGDRKTLMGGLNMDLLVAHSTREELDELIRTTIERLSPGGRFMLFPIPGLYAGCPWEKVEWLIESWNRYA